MDNLITAMKRFIRLGVDALSQHQKGGLQSVSALLQQNMVSVLQTVLGLGAMDWTHAFSDIRKTSLRATVCIKLPVHVETPTVVDRFCLTVYDENPDSTDPGDRVPVMCINCNRIELAAGQKELVIAPQIVISAELFEPWLKALWKNFTGNNGKAASYLDAVQETVAYSVRVLAAVEHRILSCHSFLVRCSACLLGITTTPLWANTSCRCLRGATRRWSGCVLTARR